jgi:hypothetical protein
VLQAGRVGDEGGAGHVKEIRFRAADRKRRANAAV